MTQPTNAPYSLQGVHVFFPRQETDPLAGSLRDLGAVVHAARLTELVARSRSELEDDIAALSSGTYAWLLITSSQTLPMLTQMGFDMRTALDAAIANGTRIGAIGAKTSTTITALGAPVHLIPADPPSAATLLAAFETIPAPSRRSKRNRVLIPGSAISSPTLPEGLAACGWLVDTRAVYDNYPLHSLPPQFVAGLEVSGAEDSVFLATSSSTARAAAELIPDNLRPRVVALGKPTAKTLGNLGWEPEATLASPRVENIIATLENMEFKTVTPGLPHAANQPITKAALSTGNAGAYVSGSNLPVEPEDDEESAPGYREGGPGGGVRESAGAWAGEKELQETLPAAAPLAATTGGPVRAVTTGAGTDLADSNNVEEHAAGGAEYSQTHLSSEGVAMATEAQNDTGNQEGISEGFSQLTTDTGSLITLPTGTLPLLDPDLAPVSRPRRMRATPAMRRLTREHRWHNSQLILPLFVREDIEQAVEIPSLPGVFQYPVSEAGSAAARAAELGLGGVLVFGVPAPEAKDEIGSAAWARDGIGNRAISAIVDAVGDEIVVIADTCLDEYTTHGQCGPVNEHGYVDNDVAVACYQRVALSQAMAGAHMVAPSGMMDGQVRAIRAALDHAGYIDTGILAYSAKFASSFYGPFRSAVGSTLQGDRLTYQQDPANRREAMMESMLDISEGADMIMVKPAGYYLDILSDVKQSAAVPVAAYQVSGEYAMIEAGAAAGVIDRRRAIEESLVSMVRAGADLLITYYAAEVADWR